jgi:phosphohistidine phosphatase
MKHLLLLRHAKSSWAEDGLTDVERPLSARGERDAPLMGERLRQRGARPGLIIASPAVRTRRTAKLIAQALDYPREGIRYDTMLYLASPTAILDIIASQSRELDGLLVVGHNPGLTDLTKRLLPELRFDDLPTAAVVAIDIDAAEWADVDNATKRLAYYDYPKNPDAAA